MKPASATPFAGKGRFGTVVPKPLTTFVWHDEASRTICPKQRFRKT
jgi:hypothetical protein